MTAAVPISRPASPELLQSLQQETGMALDLGMRRTWDYYSSYPIEELELRLNGSPPRRLIFKDLSPAAMLADARLAKLDADPLREIEIYRRILVPNGIAAPGFFAAVVDAERQRYWLFLEKVEGAPLWQVGDFVAWLAAARWLRSLPDEATCQASWHDASTALLRYDGGRCRRWLERAQQFADSAGVPEDRRRDIGRLTERAETIAAGIDALPRRFVHGEYYPSNILVEQNGRNPGIRPVDWEMAGIGPALLDLAALAAGKWTDEQRAALVAAYRGTDEPPSEEFENAFGLSRLYLALHCLAWSPAWSPPEEHQHDWLSEAMDMANRLRLL